MWGSPSLRPAGGLREGQQHHGHAGDLHLNHDPVVEGAWGSNKKGWVEIIRGADKQKISTATTHESGGVWYIYVHPPLFTVYSVR